MLGLRGHFLLGIRQQEEKLLLKEQQVSGKGRFWVPLRCPAFWDTKVQQWLATLDVIFGDKL